MRRLKSHFISLPCGVDLILGLNGYIWVSKHVKESEQEGEEGFDAEAVYSNQNDVRAFHLNYLRSSWTSMVKDIDDSTRTAISRVTNIIRALASRFVPLTDTLLLEAYNWTVDHEVGTKELLSEDSSHALATSITTQGW